MGGASAYCYSCFFALSVGDHVDQFIRGLEGLERDEAFVLEWKQFDFVVGELQITRKWAFADLA
jgi:hypothetical protein